ncbi:hypothetical protein OS493_035908 [Desmophyllum pertusum]|uniref:Uncharacterized protein n=1 Tax=Desmophyllum pertusum TaxID=174260 RepID=A0A9W9Z6Z1_9CNID|nr:hypothetical protein OS493_035908 [Desmophyllum pertusum]
MEELQNFNTNNKEQGNKHLDDKKPSDLEAPILMENENRTLEGVVKNYENELDVLRKLVPDQGEETSSISDIIKDYEDKLEGVADENKTLKDELGELQEKIGHSLFNDLQKLKESKAEATESVNEAGENGDKITTKMESTLTAPDLMNVTKLPLEDIVAIYEQDLYNLERENKVYKDGLGKGLAEALLQMAHDKDSYSCGEFETQESDAKELDNGDLEAISKSNEGMPDKPTEQKQDTMATIRETYSKYKKRPSQNDVEDEAKEDPGTGPDELKATNRPRDERKDLENSVADPAENVKQSSKQDRGDGMPGSHDVNKLDALELMRDEERAMENILKNYEKELEALRKLVPSETGEAVSVSELVKDYEDRIEKLENERILHWTC